MTRMSVCVCVSGMCVFNYSGCVLPLVIMIRPIGDRWFENSSMTETVLMRWCLAMAYICIIYVCIPLSGVYTLLFFVYCELLYYICICKQLSNSGFHCVYLYFRILYSGWIAIVVAKNASRSVFGEWTGRIWKFETIWHFRLANYIYRICGCWGETNYQPNACCMRQIDSNIGQCNFSWFVGVQLMCFEFMLL